jgi:hypothetical protein
MSSTPLPSTPRAPYKESRIKILVARGDGSGPLMILSTCDITDVDYQNLQQTAIRLGRSEAGALAELLQFGCPADEEALTVLG